MAVFMLHVGNCVGFGSCCFITLIDAVLGKSMVLYCVWQPGAWCVAVLSGVVWPGVRCCAGLSGAV